MMELSQLLSRGLSGLSQMLRTFVGPLELGLFAGGILGLVLPARGPASAKREVSLVGSFVFLVLPVLLGLGVFLGRDAYCHRARQDALLDPVYDYLIVLSLTAAFGVGRLIRGQRLAALLTIVAMLYGVGWLVATFSMLGMCPNRLP